MKLSEAIRLGSMSIPEGRGPVFLSGGDGRPCAACAIGAALYAIGRLDKATEFISFVHAEWPWTQQAIESPVVDLLSPYNGLDAIVHLFETRGWSRERVADWVETIERRADAEAVAMEPAKTTTAASAP